MKKIYALLLVFTSSTALFAQTQIMNGDFETWENVGSATEEPMYFNSNRTGTDWATSGPQTCYRDNGSHSGTYCVRMETKTFVFAVVNGSVVTGIVNAPTTTKSDGYIGTMKNTDVSDIRRMPFTGRPDSLIGYYKYTAGGSAEKGKVRAILHVGNYYDPEAASSYHPDSSMNKIADVLFLTPTSNVGTWTRFSVPFTYVDGRIPQYIMINTTSSNDQNTSVSGSKLWLDDMSVVYNSATGINTPVVAPKQSARAYCYDGTVYVDFSIHSNTQSTIAIYDVTGKVVATQKISNSRTSEINVSGLNAGMYLYRINGADFQKSGKFFVE